MNRVCCYYESMNSQYDTVVELWKESWSKFGWSPVVTTLEDARKHPHFDAVYGHVNSLPTVNIKQYENACYIRWLAAEISGLDFFTDIDTICNNFTPKDANSIKSNKFVTLTGSGCPAAVLMPPHFPVYKWILKYKADQSIMYNNKVPHCADQHLFDILVRSDPNYNTINICANYLTENWDMAKIIHFCYYSTCSQGMSKESIIRQFLDKDLM